MEQLLSMLNGIWKNVLGDSDDLADGGVQWSKANNALIINDWGSVFGIPPLREGNRDKHKRTNYLTKTIQKLVSILLKIIKMHQISIHALNLIKIHINEKDFEKYKDCFKDLEAFRNAIEITPTSATQQSSVTEQDLTSLQALRREYLAQGPAPGTDIALSRISKQKWKEISLKNQQIETWIKKYNLTQETHVSILKAENYPQTIISASVLQDLVKQGLLHSEFDTSKEYTWENIKNIIESKK